MSKKIESQLSNQQNGIRWMPFIGENYFNSPFKILLVGESHYANPNDSNDLSNNPDFTKLMVKELGIEKMNYNNIKLFNRVNSLINYNANDVVWQNICFYNFIQEVMPENIIRPTRENYINGWKSFIHVINALKPDLCIFIGTEAANSLETALNNNEEYNISNFIRGEKINGTYLRSASLNNNNHTSKLIFIKHLSKFATVSKWREKILEISPEAKNII